MNTIINDSRQDQWTLHTADCYNTQNTSNCELNFENISTDTLLENIYYISPSLYNLFESNKISLNTAKLKAKNLFISFSIYDKKHVINKLLQLKIINRYNVDKLNLVNLVF